MQLIRRSEWLWEIPQTGAMRVPGRIYANEQIIDEIRDDPCLSQVANVACLPGIVGASLAMPDIHWGYGFPIGGVAATRVEDGAVSPGGVGFDINCGVRLLRTDLGVEDVEPRLKALLDQLFRDVPAGAGRGQEKKLSPQDQEGVLTHGAVWAVEMGLGTPDDLEMLESNGVLVAARPELVSDLARRRGLGQL